MHIGQLNDDPLSSFHHIGYRQIYIFSCAALVSIQAWSGKNPTPSL